MKTDVNQPNPTQSTHSPFPFWEQKTLEEMTTEEWESLCDGCARCCLQKLEDVDSGEVIYTAVACPLVDLEQCHCTDYPNRNKNVPECVFLTRERIEEFHWLPPTCAYRLLYEGKSLPDWHPLVSGDLESVHDAGISIRNFAIVGRGDEDENELAEYQIVLPD